MLGRLNTFSGDIYLDARPSRILHLFLWVVHGAALLIVLWLPVSMLIQILLSSLIVLSAWLAYRKHISFTHPRAVKRVSWNEDEGWLLETAAGVHHEVVLDGSSFASRWVTVLNFRCGEEDKARWWLVVLRWFYPVFTVVLVADNAEADVLRRVGVKVRLMA